MMPVWIIRFARLRICEDPSSNPQIRVALLVESSPVVVMNRRHIVFFKIDESLRDLQPIDREHLKSPIIFQDSMPFQKSVRHLIPRNMLKNM